MNRNAVSFFNSVISCTFKIMSKSGYSYVEGPIFNFCTRIQDQMNTACDSVREKKYQLLVMINHQ